MAYFFINKQNGDLICYRKKKKKDLEANSLNKKDYIISSDIKSHSEMQEFMCKYSKYFKLLFSIVYMHEDFVCYLSIRGRRNNYHNTVWYKTKTNSLLNITEKDNIIYNNPYQENPYQYPIKLECFDIVSGIFYNIDKSKNPKKEIENIISYGFGTK